MIPGLDRVSRNRAKCPGIVFLSCETRIRPDSAATPIASGSGQADNAAFMGAEEIDRWLPSAKAESDLVVEIGIRQKSRPHARGA